MKQATHAALAAAIAMFAASAGAQEVYVQGGTLGAGVGAALPLSSWAGVHAELEGFGLSHTVTVDGNQYDGRLTLLQGGLYFDLFPFKTSGFRVTTGVLINDDCIGSGCSDTLLQLRRPASSAVPDGLRGVI